MFNWEKLQKILLCFQALLPLTIDLVALHIPDKLKLCPPTISFFLSASIIDTERKDGESRSKKGNN